MRLLFIRHGQTPANVLGTLDTEAPGPGLTELGHRQASRIPDALTAWPVDSLYCSTLVRTRLTAQPLADATGLTIGARGGLREIEAGELEKRRDRHSVRTYLETVFAWGAGDRDVAMPGGPDGHEFFGRFDVAVADIAADGGQTAAIVSHAAAIRVWVAAHATNVPALFAAENELGNTGIVVVEGSFETGWTLIRWADRPIGGAGLTDTVAEDPTGETLSEARESDAANGGG